MHSIYTLKSAHGCGIGHIKQVSSQTKISLDLGATSQPVHHITSLDVYIVYKIV